MQISRRGLREVSRLVIVHISSIWYTAQLVCIKNYTTSGAYFTDYQQLVAVISGRVSWPRFAEIFRYVNHRLSKGWWEHCRIVLMPSPRAADTLPAPDRCWTMIGKELNLGTLVDPTQLHISVADVGQLIRYSFVCLNLLLIPYNPPISIIMALRNWISSCCKTPLKSSCVLIDGMQGNLDSTFSYLF